MIDFLKGLFSAKNMDDEPSAAPVVSVAPALPVRGMPRPSSPPPASPQAASPQAAPPPPPPPPPPAERIPSAGPIEVDFVVVLEEASVVEVDRDRIKRAQNLLRTLPDEAPMELKRRIVEAAFATFDVPTSKIVEASSAAVAALDAYVEKAQEKTERTIAEAEERIAALEASIRGERAAIDRAKDVQQQRVVLAAHEAKEIQPIVGFFAAAALAVPSVPPLSRAVAPMPSQVPPALVPDEALVEPDEALVEERPSQVPDVARDVTP
jgi:hypothetical protein